MAACGLVLVGQWKVDKDKEVERETQNKVPDGKYNLQTCQYG